MCDHGLQWQSVEDKRRQGAHSGLANHELSAVRLIDANEMQELHFSLRGCWVLRAVSEKDLRSSRSKLNRSKL